MLLSGFSRDSSSNYHSAVGSLLSPRDCGKVDEFALFEYKIEVDCSGDQYNISEKVELEGGVSELGSVIILPCSCEKFDSTFLRIVCLASFDSDLLLASRRLDADVTRHW